MSFKFFNASGQEQVLRQYADSLVDLPVGTITMTGRAGAPDGWLLCDGSAVSRSAYGDLYAQLGTYYGAGNGSTTFNVPSIDGAVIFAVPASARIPLGAPPELVTSLPSTPRDGLEVYYVADSTNGVIWHLRYRAASSSAYKWECVGGPPLISTVVDLTGQSTAATHTTYQGLTTALTVAAPEKGDYVVILGAEVVPPSTAGDYGIASYKIGSTAASDNDRVLYSTSAAVAVIGSVHREQLKTLSGATLSDRTLTAQYKSSTTTAAKFYNRWLGIMPVRVG